MKVICTALYDDTWGNLADFLTIGKTYDVIGKDRTAGYLIRNDNNDEHFYRESYFRLLSDMRDDIIDGLLE